MVPTSCWLTKPTEGFLDSLAGAVAVSEALTPSVVTHGACGDVGLAVRYSPEVLFVIKTDSQVTQLQKESVYKTYTDSQPVQAQMNTNQKQEVRQNDPQYSGALLETEPVRKTGSM